MPPCISMMRGVGAFASVSRDVVGGDPLRVEREDPLLERAVDRDGAQDALRRGTGGERGLGAHRRARRAAGDEDRQRRREQDDRDADVRAFMR